MVFDIINPEEPCTIESDDFEVACVAVSLLGNGLYGLLQCDGKISMPTMMFRRGDEWFYETFGCSESAIIEKCMNEKKQKVIKALESLLLGCEYDRNAYREGLTLLDDEEAKKKWRDSWNDARRKSFNNISIKAREYADKLRKRK